MANGIRKLDKNKISGSGIKRRLDPDKIHVDTAYVYKLQNDVSEKRLRRLNESLEKIRSGWQDKETMEKTRKELSSVRESIDRYNNFLSLSGSKNGNDRLNALSNAYGQMLEDFDSYASTYREAEDYVRGQKSKFVGAAREEYVAKASADLVKEWQKEAKAYYDKWGHLAEEADFDEYVKKGEAKTADPDEYLRQFGMPSTDPVRWLTGTRDRDDTYTLVAKGFSDMTEDEKKIYNYLLGKEGAEYANEFLADIESNLDTRGGARQAQKILDIENPLLRGAATIGAATAQGASGALVNPGKYFWSEEDTKAVNPANVAEQVVLENSDPITRILADTGSNIGNMLPYMALGGAASALGAKHGMAANAAAKIGQTVGAAGLGAGAAGDAYQRGITQYGLSEDQARLYGAAVGLSEATLQKAIGGISAFGGIDESKLIAKADMINNAALRVAAKLGIKIGAEEIEEFSQNYLEPLFRKVISGEEYDAPTLAENIETAIVTALSTGVLEGGGTISNDVRETALQNARLDMRYSGQEDAFNAALTQVLGQERAAEMLEGTYLPSKKEVETARGLAEADSAQTSETLNEYARALAQDESEVNPESRELKRLQQSIDSGDLSGRQIDRMVNQRENRWSAQDAAAPALHDKEVIQAAAENRLAELGETYDTAAIAEAVARQVAGEKLTRQERRTLENSEYGVRVANEMDPANVGTGEYSNAYVEGLEPTQFYRPFSKGFPPQSAIADSSPLRGGSLIGEGVATTDNILPRGEDLTEQEANRGLDSSGISEEPHEFEASADGKTVITDTGETVQIAEIASIKNGKMKLRLQSGEEIDAEDVSYASPGEALLYETALNMGTNAAVANALIQNYRPEDGVSADIYALGVEEAYRYGRYGIPAEEMSTRGFSAVLTQAQRAFAYGLGQSDRRSIAEQEQAEVQKKKAAASKKERVAREKRGTVTFEKGVQAVTERQKVSVAALEKVAEVLGVDFHLFESEADAEGRRVGANGWYEDSSIYLDIHAGVKGEDTILFTAAHELTHFIREWSPAKFKTFADFLFAEYGKKGVSVDALIERQIKKAKETGRSISYGTAYEEVVADSCETMLADGRAVEKLARLKAQDKSLWEKIRDFIRELAAKIRAVYEGLSPDSPEGRYVAQMKDAADRLQDMFTEALADAGEAYRTAGKGSVAGDQSMQNGTKKGNLATPEGEQAPTNTPEASRGTVSNNSIRNKSKNVKEYSENKESAKKYSIREAFADEYDKWDKKNPRTVFNVGTTSEVLKDLGIPDTSILWDASKIIKIKSKHPEMTDTIIKQVPQILENPIIVMKSKTSSGRITLFGEVFSNNKPILAVLELNPTGRNGVRLDELKIASAYGKDNAQRFIDSSQMLYKDSNKKRISNWERRTGLQLPVGTFITDSNSIVTQESQSVNIQSMQSDAKKYSIREAFADEIDAWDGKEDKTFYIGNTSEALQSIGIKKSDIIWRSRKIGAILRKHAGMSKEIIKQVPYILENPVVILQSQNSDSRLAIFGEVTDKNGAPVTAILELQPTNKGGQILDMNVIASAYGKDSNPAGFIMNSGLVYLDENEKRTKRWLQGLGLQLPSDTTAIGSIGSISYSDGKVKIESTPASQYMQYAKDSIHKDRKFSMRDYSYEALTEKPDMQVTTLSEDVPKNRADVVYEAKKNAAKIGKRNKDGSVTVHVKDIDRDVVIGTRGLQHGLDRRFNTNAPVALQAGEILQNSIQINEMNPEKAEADSSYVLIGAAQSKNGQLYIVRSVVNGYRSELASMDVLYAMNAKTEADLQMQKENRLGDYPRGGQHKGSSPSGSTISISELLDSVNRYFPDILPEDVLRHYGHTERPAGRLGESALYSMRDPQQIAEWEEIREILTEENRKLREDNENLQQLVELQQKVAHGTKITKSSVEVAAKALKKEANATGNTAQLSALLTEFYGHISDGIGLSSENAAQAVRPVVDWLISNSKAESAVLSPELERQKLIAEVYDSYWRVSTLQEAAQPIQRDINRLKMKHRESMERLRATHREHVAELRESYKEKTAQLRREHRADVLRRQQEITDKYRQSRQKGIESRRKTAMRQKIKRAFSELNHLLLHGTKERNIKIGLQKTVAELLDIVNMDTVDAQRRVAEYDALIAAETDPAKIEKLTESRNRIRLQGERLGERLAAFKAEYTKIKESEDPLIANAHDEVIEAQIESVQSLIGDTPLRNMSLEQLTAVYELFQAVRTSVKNANRAFVMNKEEGIAQQAEAIEREIQKTGENKAAELKKFSKIKQFSWDMLKPVYAFRAMGSPVFEQAFWKLQEAEGGWAADYGEARDFFANACRTYGYNSWDLKEKRTFRSADGRNFSMDLLERMDFYLASRREQGRKHLLQRGFGFETDVEVVKKAGIPVEYKNTTKKNYMVTEELIDKIGGTLTQEQKQFAEKLQQYLAKEIGQKLDEVSLELYGIKKYGETGYWPLTVMREFVETLNEQATNQSPLIKNRSFTKALNENASSPILIGKVTDIWARHVFEACNYHNFTLPLEDFRRVFNYKAERGTYSSVEKALREAYGTGPVEYLKRLYLDLNGGPTNQDGAMGIDKFMSLAKRAAVMASASVVIQQPSSILRATAYISPKYFAAAIPGGFNWAKHNEKWNECKKYAPVARIKEMGYFDMGMGSGSTAWLTAKEYDRMREKAWALFKDGTYRDEVLSKAPAMADELTWVYLWEAVKKETEAKTGLRPGSEELLQAAGKRFTEVVALTQVYDSTLSRSGLMRKRDTGWKAATAFMGEPTVTENMFVDAVIQGKRTGGLKGAKIIADTAGAILSSVLLNSVLKSIVTAGRDDDEDETYLEKYFGELTGNFFNDINPLTYIPWGRDILSLLQGYSVDRMDMTVFADLIKSIRAMDSDSKTQEEKIAGLAGSISTFFGIPLKNVTRDINAFLNTVRSFKSGNKTTKAGIKMSIEEEITGEEFSNAERIYTYYSSGEVSEVTYMVDDMMQKGLDSGKTEDEARSSIRSSMTSLLKPMYLVAYIAKDEDEMKKIRLLMQKIGVYGTVGDIINDCKKWVKDLEDEEKTKKAIDKVEKAGLYYPDIDVERTYEKLLKSLAS